MNAETGEATESCARRFGLCKMFDMTRKINDRLNARRARLRNHFITISIKFRRVKMAVTIDPHQLIALRCAFRGQGPVHARERCTAKRLRNKLPDFTYPVEVDAGADAHAMQHVEHVLRRHVAGCALGVRAAPEPGD